MCLSVFAAVYSTDFLSAHDSYRVSAAVCIYMCLTVAKGFLSVPDSSYRVFATVCRFFLSVLTVFKCFQLSVPDIYRVFAAVCT